MKKALPTVMVLPLKDTGTATAMGEHGCGAIDDRECAH